MKESGILLHISSLPSKYGIGTFGKEAYKFVDFLKKSNTNIWQILPIGPTSYGDSPYQSLSSFAINPYFIDLDMLVEGGLLEENEIVKLYDGRRVSYGDLFNTRFNILNKAFLRRNKYENEFNEFIKDNDYWLDDYALYMVLKKEHDNKSWQEWYDDFKYRKNETISWAKNEFKDKILEIKFQQFLAFNQYLKLKKYANKKGIKIMGDIPIYCSLDSSDVWANPKLFLLDNSLKPTLVAGCPPDAFTELGQLWGNPLYNYDFMKNDNYSWWVKRVKASLNLFDMLRIDHFRGFESYYAIPASDNDARGGHWEKGPGYDLFKAIKKECKNANIVAENLGFLTRDVHKLLNKCGYPGMHIFQFELGDGKKNIPLKKGFKNNNIFYTGTHDNQTILSYYVNLDTKYKNIVDKECKIGFYDKPNLKIIEFAFNQNCDYVIIPIQDYLGLTDDIGRMNTPGTSIGNWQFRCLKEDFSSDLASYISDLNYIYKK